MYTNKGFPHYHYVPPPEPPTKKSKPDVLGIIGKALSFVVLIALALVLFYEDAKTDPEIRLPRESPSATPSPTPHVFGSNELTKMGRAILNGAVLYTPAPNGNPSRRYKAVFDAAYSIDPERSYGTIGNDLYFDFWVNGERVLRGEKIEICAGETIEFKVAITEEDDKPDYGYSRVTFTVPNDVKRGKKYSAVKGVFVAEHGGNQYSHGCYKTFIVEFSLSVKGKIRR